MIGNITTVNGKVLDCALTAEEVRQLYQGAFSIGIWIQPVEVLPLLDDGPSPDAVVGGTS